MSISALETEIQNLRTKGNALIAAFNAQVQAINEDGSRTPEWKAQAARELREQSSGELKQLGVKEKTAIEQALKDRTQRLAGNATPLSGMDAIAQRDADERVARVTNASDAHEMMRRALESQDSTLAKTLLVRAVENGFTSAAEMYLEQNEWARTTLADVDEITRMQSLGRQFERSMFYGAL